jgi:subtilisin-like proprotein convertase family protein
MNGTSSASPTVAGSIALVLEACPDLTWRDVKYLVAKNAKQIDSSNSSWVTNNAGFHHSVDYGFGRIDAKAMIDECTNGYTNLPDETNTTNTVSFNEVVPDDGSKDFNVTVDDNITIEWVEVTIDNDISDASEYKIELTSPQNTKTVLMTSDTETSSDWMKGGWRFSTAAMLGESSKGDWNVTMTDTNDNDKTGKVSDITITIYGH